MISCPTRKDEHEIQSGLSALLLQYTAPYFWSTDRRMHTHTHTNPFHALLIYKRPYFWVSPIPIISSSALSVLHPAASNQKPDLSASHVWLQHKWMSASFSTVCLGVPRGWNWDLNMLRRFFPPTWGVYKDSSPSATHAIPILIRLKMLQNVLHNHSLTLTV